MSAVPHAPVGIPDDEFATLLRHVEKLGETVVAPAAIAVDRDARFPSEAFAAFREARLLGAWVPPEFGGLGLGVTQICRLCETMGRYCASTAMVFAMHQIQVACILHHGRGSPWMEQLLRDLCARQLLLASATTEVGTGGDLRSSICALEADAGRFRLRKEAPVISYALDADAILITCRRHADAPSHDQLHVVALKQDCTLEEISGWDTLGFRGTCSSGFTVNAAGSMEQVIPVPFADVLAQSMHPVAHLTWGSLWLGLASDAVRVARASVRAAARKSPGVPQVAGLRLSEVDEQLFSMRSGLYLAIRDYEELRAAGNPEAFSGFGFSIRTNNVKLRCSEMLVDIVGKAMMIVGIAGYRNTGPSSLARHLRDAYGAALMVNNDRIRGHNAAMQIALRES